MTKQYEYTKLLLLSDSERDGCALLRIEIGERVFERTFYTAEMSPAEVANRLHSLASEIRERAV